MKTESYNHKIINFLFWLSFIICLAPRLLFYWENHNFAQNLDIQISKGWTLEIEGVRFQKIDLPQNVENVDGFNQSFKHFYLLKGFSADEIQNYENPVFVAGRIGDSDKVYLNSCLIGQTGIKENNKQSGYWWNQLRYYKIPKTCLQSTNTLKIEIYKWGGPGYGVFGGPIGFGEDNKIRKIYEKVEYLWSGIFQLFGIILLAIGIYYFIVYILVKAKKYNLYFSLTSFFIGCYELITTAVPYRNSSNGVPVLKVSLLFSILGGYFVLRFFNERFNFQKPKIIKIFNILLLVPAFGLILSDFDTIFNFYQIWFLIYIVAIVVTFISFSKFVYRNKIDDGWRYQVGFSIFLITVLHDIFATQFSLNAPYTVPFGFATMIIVVAITLAKEYADAFLYVEAQVGERTKDLSEALEQLKGLEKMKERFFANISHDLKTPITIQGRFS